ncbi:hypothetical protein EJ110_NYTH57215 [Nymphaea thermarum]|nr:hypothetical protein EJ110_NYTH57215 [Nymphaea thermarum]
MADSSSSSSVHTNVPDVGSTRAENVPVQVTTIQLNKENYIRWSAAITLGIAGRGCIAYVNGRKVEPVEGSIAWDTWYLEDNQVKMWIINSVSSDIQPLILRKKTARDMWVILEHMVFLFLSSLNDDYENIRSQILNSDESFSIEDVYARVEAEEQRKLISSDRKGEEQSAFVSRASVGSSRSSRKCTHCKKLGHTIDFCWDLHPEKKNSKGRPSASKQREFSATGPGDRKGSFSAEQLRELRAYLSQADGGQTEKSDDVLDKDKEDISVEAHELGKKKEEVEKDVPPMVTEQEGTRIKCTGIFHGLLLTPGLCPSSWRNYPHSLLKSLRQRQEHQWKPKKTVESVVSLR